MSDTDFSALPLSGRPPANTATLRQALRLRLPGLGLCGAVTCGALALEVVERHMVGRAWLEALVLAILLGTAVRSLFRPGRRFAAGIACGAKLLLEIAVLLLGASVSFRNLGSVGPALLFGIACVVALVIPSSFLLCRWFGLPRRMAILVACGNSICGNSAIAAVAPVIGAGAEDVAASISFTAVLGVIVVLGLPPLVPLLGLSQPAFGILSGLTVYAVPQVIAAAAPVGPVAVQIGTLVKLVRVLMLGPVMLVLSLLARRRAIEGQGPAKPAPVPLHRVVPWFILGFLGLAALHSLGFIPAAVLQPTAAAANVLTVLSMAALGLGVDLGTVLQAGIRVTAAVTASLLLLGAMSLGLIRLLGIA